MVELNLVESAREVGLVPVESPVAPGALASSEILNRYFQSLDATVRDLQTRVMAVSTWSERWQAWMASAISVFNTTLDQSIAQITSAATGSIYVDVHSSMVTAAPAGMIDPVYCQAVPPVVHSRTITTSGSPIYMLVASAEPTLGSSPDMLVGSLDPGRWDQAIPVPRLDPNATEYVQIRCDLVVSSGEWLPNSLELVFLPQIELKSILLVRPGSSNYTLLNQSYSRFVADRIWWDPRQVGPIAAVVIQARMPAGLYPALVRLAVSSTRFAESGTLSISVPAGRVISAYTLDRIFPTSAVSIGTQLSGDQRQLSVSLPRVSPMTPVVLRGVQLSVS